MRFQLQCYGHTHITSHTVAPVFPAEACFVFQGIALVSQATSLCF